CSFRTPSLSIGHTCSLHCTCNHTLCAPGRQPPSALDQPKVCPHSRRRRQHVCLELGTLHGRHLRPLSPGRKVDGLMHCLKICDMHPRLRQKSAPLAYSVLTHMAWVPPLVPLVDTPIQ